MTSDAGLPNFDLDTRAGWPADLRFLVDRYPRAVWPAHVNLGPLSQFWLDIHRGFRDMSGKLQSASVDFREGVVTPEEYRAWFAPRLRMFLTHLNGHHQIEDYQFFPLFGAAEPRLLRGFEVLEADHHSIHAAMQATAEAANALLRAPETDADALRSAGNRYAAAGDALLKKLTRHLDDEEDLIIPLILDRSEPALGI